MKRYIFIFFIFLCSCFSFAFADGLSQETTGAALATENASEGSATTVNADANTADKMNESADLYPEITSQPDWFIGRVISSYKYTGVRDSHSGAVEGVFRRYIRKVFSYDLLSDLQRDLFATGFFSRINPAVDITIDKELELVFDFKEIPTVGTISFVSYDSAKPLEVNSRTLADTLDYYTGDSKTEDELNRTISSIKKYYDDHGRPDTKVTVQLKFNEEKNVNDIVYIVDEDVEKRVGDITFRAEKEGDSLSFTSAILLKQIKSSRNGYYEVKNTEEDLEKLTEYYKKNGFRDVKILPVELKDISQPEDKVCKLNLEYVINEGIQWKVGTVSFSGNNVYDSDTLMKELSLKTGNIFDAEKFAQDKTNLMILYYNQGYVFVVLDVKEIPDENDDSSLNLEYQIVEGNKAYIEKIYFTGLSKTKEYVFRRELSLNEGDVFSRDGLQKSFQNIYNTGLVKNVSYNLNRGSDNEHLNLEFEIEEAQQMDVTFGITFGGNESGFPLSFLVSLNDKNLVGTGMTLSTGVQVTTDYQSVSLSFGSGWFKDLRWANSFSLSFERSVKDNILQKNPNSDFLVGRNEAFPFGYSSYSDYEAFDEAVPDLRYLMTYEMYRFSLGYTTGYTWMFGPGKLSLSGGLSFGLNHVTYNESEYIPYEYLIYQYRQGWRFSNRLSISLTWDGRDYVDDTTKGYLLSQSFVYAGGFLGGLSNYIKSSTTASGYLALFTTGSKDEIKPRAFVASYTTTVSLMLPQFWNTSTDRGHEGWGWHDSKYGATRSEMLYIDGMRVARGHGYVYDISFMWDNMLEFSYPIVKNILNAEIFGSMTAVSKQLENVSSNLIWYGAFGIGVKLKISGFPLGIYFVGDYRIKGTEFKWIDGGLFNYVHPVIAISTSLI